MDILRILAREDGVNNREHAYNVLYNTIMNLLFIPGTVLQESKIAAKLQVSRTPVREAIFQLREERLVEIEPRRSSTVTKISPLLVEEARMVRTALESSICHHLCGNLDTSVTQRLYDNLILQEEAVQANDTNAFLLIDKEFHEILYLAAGKPDVWAARRSLNSHLERINHLESSRNGGFLNELYQSHKDIYYCLLTGLSDEIDAVFTNHFSISAGPAKECEAIYPEYFQNDSLADLPGSAKPTGQNSSELAYHVIRSRIMNMELAPGQLLNEGQFAGELRISRTPVREAILRLKEEKLVEVYPQRASVVSLIDFSIINQSFFLRKTLEPQVLRMAAERLSESSELQAVMEKNLAEQQQVLQENLPHSFFRLDNEFHQLLYHMAGIPHIWEFINKLSGHYNRLRYFDVVLGTMKLRGLHWEHAAIWQALLDGHCEDAVGLLEPHLAGFQDTRPFLLPEYRSYFRGMEAMGRNT